MQIKPHNIRYLHEIHPLHTKFVLDKLVLPNLKVLRDPCVIVSEPRTDNIVVVIVRMTHFKSNISKRNQCQEMTYVGI